MMLLDATPPPPAAMRFFDPAGEQGDGDAALIALMLIAVWAARTGRALRDVPVGELTPEELIEFWADDQLEEPYATAAEPFPLA